MFKIPSFFILFYFIPQISFAWNFTNHILISQLSYGMLTLDEQKYVDNFAHIALSNLPNKVNLQLKKKFPHTSDFAKATLLPDLWHEKNIQDIFTSYHTPLPKELADFSHNKTGAWHYIDRPYPKDHMTKINQENIVSLLKILVKNFSQTHDANTKALLFIFITHLLADIHQPLHNITYVTKYGMTDAGGNKFCLHKIKNGFCIMNLHQLWDNALMMNTPKKNILVTERITFSKEFNPETWSLESYHYADFIYKTKKFSFPSNNYLQEGSSIANLQIIKASYRLKNLILNLKNNNLTKIS